MPKPKPVPTNKNLRGGKSKGKLSKKAQLAEEERLAEEARLLEEARLAEEEAKEEAIRKELSTSDGKMRDLMKWLNTLPLSLKCFKRMDREFSDGVLVGEIVAHYRPDICQKKLLYPCFSSENKVLNWDYMNRQVFPRIGFKVKRKVINNLMQPWGCGKFDKTCSSELLIYKLLFKVQECLGKRTPNFYDYRRVEGTKTPGIDCNGNMTIGKESSVQVAEDPKKLNKIVASRSSGKPTYSKIEILIANGYYDKEPQSKDSKTESSENSKSEVENLRNDFENFATDFSDGNLFEDFSMNNDKTQYDSYCQGCEKCLQYYMTQQQQDQTETFTY